MLLYAPVAQRERFCYHQLAPHLVVQVNSETHPPTPARTVTLPVQHALESRALIAFPVQMISSFNSGNAWPHVQALSLVILINCVRLVQPHASTVRAASRVNVHPANQANFFIKVLAFLPVHNHISVTLLIIFARLVTPLANSAWALVLPSAFIAITTISSPVQWSVAAAALTGTMLTALNENVWLV